MSKSLPPIEVQRLVPRELLERMATSLGEYYQLLVGADQLPAPLANQIVLDAAAVFVNYALAITSGEESDD